jgi:altronate hydrolase
MHLQIHPKDNIWVALRNLSKGQTFQENNVSVTLIMDIEAKHKFTITPIKKNEDIIFYGVLVGKALQDIEKGEKITTENCVHESEPYSMERRSAYHFEPPDISNWQNRTFKGFVRSDGQVGTRNYWLVIPLVFCENRNIQIMKEAFDKELGFGQPEKYRPLVRNLLHAMLMGADIEPIELAAPWQEHGPAFPNPFFPQVDGIKFLTHEMGCGGTNQDCQTLAAVFAGFCINPNVAGITVLSLGCQKTSFDDLKEEIHRRTIHFDKPLLYFNQQSYGTEQAMISAAINETFKGLIEINKLQRTSVSIQKLNVGLKCGGSDGFSGISANPALGALSDILTTLGATTLLAEFPELCGVEQALIDRCVKTEDAEKFIALMSGYAMQAEAIGAGFDMNPSKGNIRDGLITDAIKSAGAAKKGGNAPIKGVLDYTEQPEHPGLHLLCTPGNDVLATTGMAASGANIILFTTGLGTPTGNAITPTVKISTHTALMERMPDIIDFNSGKIISGEESIHENGAALLEYIIQLASGEIRTHAERLGQDDFIPWRRGINL